MEKVINFNDSLKDTYLDIDKSNGEVFDISPERLNFIIKEKEKEELQLKSKYKNVNKIDCISYDCFWGYIQEIILTSNSGLFTKMLENIIRFRINYYGGVTSYNLIKLYENDKLVDEFKIYYNSLKVVSNVECKI